MIDLSLIEQIATKSAKEALKIYNQDFDIDYKEDNSPLTKADLVSNDIICNQLAKYYSFPILSEENKQANYNIRKSWEYYWCIDPIDGTKEFINKNHQWTINIALIHYNTPILGVVYAPALNIMYSADAEIGAYKTTNNQKQILKHSSTQKQFKKNNLKIAISKSHLDTKTKQFVEQFKNTQLISIGSSLKLCMVADSSVDLYPRFSPTMEWDTAAGDAIVRATNKMSYIYNDNFDLYDTTKAKPLQYNKPDLLNPSFIVI